MLASVGAVVVLAIGAGLYVAMNRGGGGDPGAIPESEMRKFTGDVRAIVAGKITLYGMIYAPAGTRLAQEHAAPREFDFFTDNTTRFLKSVTRFPTWEEIEAMGGRFRLEDLPREEVAGSADDLFASFSAGGVYVEADFRDDLTKYPNPVAERVIYRIFEMPAAGPSGTDE